jgi:hypothetical protein
VWGAAGQTSDRQTVKAGTFSTSEVELR